MDAPRADAEQLALAAKAGDRAALSALYPLVAPALVAWARLRVRARLRVHLDPDDLVQDVWVRAMGVLTSFAPERCTFRAWLFRVAKNVLLEVQRAAHRGVPGSGETSVLGRLHAIPADVTSVTQRVSRDEGVQAFLAEVEKLDPIDRRLVVHCGLEEMTQVEAAAMLGIDYEALAKRWQRLRAKLATWGAAAGLG